MTGETPTPDVVVLDFLEQLPITIKDSVLYMCCSGMDMFDFPELAKGDLLELLREVLDQPDRSTAYTCARLIGVLELVLERDEDGIEADNWALHSETGEEIFRSIAMRQPFEKRHWRSARNQFAKLRQGDLSSASLHRWQSFLPLSFPDEQDE